MSPYPTSVLVNAHALQRNFLPMLALALKARQGCKVHLVCNGPAQRSFYEAFEGAFDSIAIVTRDRRRPEDGPLDEPAALAEARAWEAELGQTYNELLTSDRHFGRGFALAGPGHPRSRLSEETGYPEVVDIYNRRLAFWSRRLEETSAELVINGPRELSALTMARDIPFRWLIRARFGNHYYWAHDDRPMNPAIEARFHALPDDVEVSPQQDQPFSYEQGRRKFETMHRNALHLAHNLGRRVALHAYWHWTGSEKAKGYYLSEELKYLIRAWRANRRLRGGGFARLADLEGKPFVYFPLQQEPEASTQGWSREYFFQHATIAQICRDLPAGVPLAVKETYFAAGRRPADFYEQVRDFKNVVFLDIREPGLEVVKRAAVVVTIAGSSGHEAAAIGKPVITFGRYNHFNFLPHVKVIRDGADLKRHLHAFLAGDYDAERAVKDGRRMLRALADVGFDMEDFDYIAAGKPSERVVARACEALLESIDREPTRIDEVVRAG